MWARRSPATGSGPQSLANLSLDKVPLGLVRSDGVGGVGGKADLERAKDKLGLGHLN